MGSHPGWYLNLSTKTTALNNQNVLHAYYTVFIGIRLSYPGVKTAGLQYESCLRHSFVHEASSGGTTDIVAMEFIPLKRINDVVAMKIIPLKRINDVVAMKIIPLNGTNDKDND